LLKQFRPDEQQLENIHSQKIMELVK